MTFSRRDFVKTSVLGAVAAGVSAPAAVAGSHSGELPVPESGSYKRPIIVCANNGFAYLEAAFAFLKSGGDTLDAAINEARLPI